VRLAGHTAQALRPKGYDAQVVYLITLLQNLGRLMLRYHFADEAEQIAQLMRPAPPSETQPEQPGLSEEAAAFAVLGVDIESLGAAVARHWGLSEDVLHMVRRLPADATVRKPDSDAEVLRLTASAANEAVDATQLQVPAKVAAAIAQVAQRYARVLGISTRDVNDSLQAARERLLHGAAEVHPVGKDSPDQPDAQTR
jgi:non-specific serine/threonine protein kinase